MNRAAEIKIRAERRGGEILSEVERKDRPKGSTDPAGVRRQGGEVPGSYLATIKAASIPETTARRWQEEASVPEPIFEQFVATAKEAEAELTSSAVVELARTVKDRPNRVFSKAVQADPNVRWAKQMRALSFATRILVEIAKKVQETERALIAKALDRCVADLKQARKEIA